MLALKRMATRGRHTRKKTVVETVVSTRTTLKKIKIKRWIAMCRKGALSTPLKRPILMWSFSWHYEGMKEDALQKGLPAPDEAVVRELVLAKNVEAPALAT